MRRIVSLCAGFAILGLSSAAAAFQQQPPPPPPPQQMPPSETYDMRHPNSSTASGSNFQREYDSRVVMRFEDQPKAAYTQARTVAQCILRRAKDKTKDLIGGPMTDDPTFQHLSSALTGKYSLCYQKSAEGLPLLVLNGVLAEEALRVDAAALPRFSTPTDEAKAKAFYASSEGVTIDSVARCLSVYSPGLVNSVLQTGVGTPAETTALQTLYAETPACNVRTPPKNVPSIEQRSALAAGLYTWTHKG